MRIAIPVWGKSVSTVFDSANRLTIIDFKAGQIKERYDVNFIENTIIRKAARLKELGVEVLICGAISRPLTNMITASGIRVVPFVRGVVDEVIHAYCNNLLPDTRYIMPGYCPNGWAGKGRVRRHGRGKRRV